MKYTLRSLMTFSIRDLFLVTLVVASLAGCKSKSAVAPKPTELPAASGAVSQQITKERAAEIVRELIAKKSPESVFDCEAREKPDGFSVTVIFGSKRDAAGRLEGTRPAGSHVFYRLSKTGEVMGLVTEP